MDVIGRKWLAPGVGLAIVLLACSAWADSVLKQAPEHEKAIQRCALLKSAAELPPKKVDELPRDGEHRVYKITGHRGKVYVAFILGRGEKAACQALEFSKPVAKARGTFYPSKGGQGAKIIRGGVCNPTDGCLSMLVFVTRRGEMISATRRDGCARGEKLKKESLFGGSAHSLRTVCHSTVGDRETETITSIVHIFNNKPVTIFTMSHGIARTTVAPASKGKEKQCTTSAGGWVKVAMRGSAPLLRTFQPLDAIESDDDFGAPAAKPAAGGKTTGRQTVWKFDAEEKVFVELEERRRNRTFVNKPKCKRVKVTRPAAGGKK